MANYDIVGGIAVLKTEGMTKKEVKKQVEELLKRPNIKTVVEKSGRIKGRLRTLKVRYLAGEKNLITIHKESGCLFRVNVEKCYFSSRLSNERLEVAQIVRKAGRKANVLVMFSGVAPFSIIIAKIAKPKKIISVELGKECNKLAKQNLKLNKVENIELIQGDVKRVIPKLKKKKEKFDIIIMPRPNLKDTFLKQALSVSKKGTRIIYYGFCRENELKEMVEEIRKEAVKAKKEIKILRTRQAGDIAPYKHRYRIEMRVL